MKYVKRFVFDRESNGLFPDEDGGWVRFEDYIKERQSFRKSRDNLNRILSEIAELVQRDQNEESLLDAVKRAVSGKT